MTEKWKLEYCINRHGAEKKHYCIFFYNKMETQFFLFFLILFSIIILASCLFVCLPSLSLSLLIAGLLQFLGEKVTFSFSSPKRDHTLPQGVKQFRLFFFFFFEIIEFEHLTADSRPLNLFKVST